MRVKLNVVPSFTVHHIVLKLQATNKAEVILTTVWERCCRLVDYRSTQSTSPVSSQSAVDIDASKATVIPGGGVMDPGFDNPSVDLSSIAHTTTPQSGRPYVVFFPVSYYVTFISQRSSPEKIW